MTIITTEIQKWKRNKIVWCILALTLLLGAFAIERACSISRSSPFMDSFGDLYTLAFKNLSSLFLPIVLGMFATTLFFDEHKNDTMKELLIIPITKAQLYFSKVAVVILMSVGLCLITFLLCVVGGLIAGGFPDLNAQTLMDAGLLILDEPTNGLDPIGIAEVRNFIKNLSVERGKTILISSHILSEISLLADDIGIIDHGVLLEESSMEELEKKNRKYIQLQVSDIPKASLILERQFHVTDYAVQDEHNLRLYDTALDMAAINKALVVQDVAVISSQICNDTLEDYFKQITGGEGIA